MQTEQSRLTACPVRASHIFRSAGPALIVVLLLSHSVPAIVKLDEGSRLIKGVQLLQDYSDASAYYYVPIFPRLATKKEAVSPDGEGAKAEPVFEFLCIKYVGRDNIASGGLFHALVEFTLPPEIIEGLEAELKKEVPGGRIVGPVPLLQTVEGGEEALGSFNIVSAVLTNTGEGGFTRSVVTSGRAPVTPGSRAAVAAILNATGATLLWDTFQAGTSDVSVAIRAYYEAAVKGYNAIVTAEMTTVYEHFSRVSNVQQGYTKRQLRKVVDELQRNGVLKVEVFDRSAGTGIKASDMEAILSLVTDKLTELMFNHETGWAKEPPREVAVELGQIQGRQERGWFSRVFGGAQDTPYFTDDQYVVKNRKDIQQNKFYLNLSKSSTIKVYVDTAGNLGGLYEQYKPEADPRYFRIVNLDDPAYQTHQVHFQIDGDYLDAFKDTVNLVSINFRKPYGADRPDFTASLVFSHEDVKQGKTIQTVTFPRLGLPGSWREYEYQVRWNLRDVPEPLGPTGDQWIRSQDPAVSLTPPFRKRVVEMEADFDAFKTAKMRGANVEFAAYLGGSVRKLRTVNFRVAEPQAVATAILYQDRGAKQDQVGYRVTWYSQTGSTKGDFVLLDTDYILLLPPSPGSSEPNSPGGAL